MKSLDEEALTSGETGTFGQAIVSLQRGFNIARMEWGGKCFIVKQINSDIASDIVPKMQSLPDAARKKSVSVQMDQFIIENNV